MGLCASLGSGRGEAGGLRPRGTGREFSWFQGGAGTGEVGTGWAIRGEVVSGEGREGSKNPVGMMCREERGLRRRDMWLE